MIRPNAEVATATPADDAARREAVKGRDPAADGTSVGSARATGVDCRPPCPPPPSRPRRAGASIRSAIGETWLGLILVAASDVGVCAILLGDDPEELARDARDRFPGAGLAGGDAALERRVAEVVALVESPSAGLALPLDIRGTAFQHRVWGALREIPPGSTASYAEVAARIGRPGSARAVATACAANPIAVAIPCHRVVRADGSLSGYRWGVDRKARLLRRERGEA